MLAVVVVLVVVVSLLAVVTVGLLRSHADILRALHELGAGVGDPLGGGAAGPAPVRLRAAGSAAAPMGPAERDRVSAPDLSGVTPGGDAVAVAMAVAPRSLLVFLSTGCASCAAVWSELGDPAARSSLDDVRLVVVTKGPDFESPQAVATVAPAGVQVVMSTEAWTAYEVPGSPYFALVDGRAGVRVGEGVGGHLAQIAELIGRAQAEASPPVSSSPVEAVGLSGAEREDANDRQLLAAGIGPGHPSLYPPDLAAVFPPAAAGTAVGPAATAEADGR